MRYSPIKKRTAYDAHRNEQQIASALAIAQKATALAESQTAAAQREKRRADKMAQNARTALYEAQREGLKERLEKRVADQTLIVQLLAPNLERRSTSVYPGARYNQARDVGRQANAANLRSAIAWVRRGNGLLYGDRGDVDEAIGAYRKAIAVDRDYEPAYDRLALAYEKEDDYNRAIANFNLAVGFSPDASHIAQRAAAYEQKGAYDRALADYDQIIQRAPGDTTYVQQRALAYERTGDDVKARADFDRIVQRSPENTMYQVQRAMAAKLRGNSERAFADYDWIIARDSRGYEERGIGYFCEGRFRSASGDFSRALRLRSMNAYAALWLQLTRWKTGSDDPAAFVKRAARLDRTAWPGPIVELFAGTAVPDEVRAVARRTDSPDHTHVCEASFYLGEYALAHHDRAGGHELLSDAVSTCPNSDFFVYAAARTELKRLGT
jgi:tetratricopeptide (TPR) repeat protein